ncbi:MAG: hypothetical protein H7842_14295 [Gammaproteobacteria bacterium SHHR-1]|uniref:hypothetical protein n=1 Tax=Magnetovirga frankeli TaxID=947516 RepID=UPI001293C233|nr:hypothetical protein D5125_00505 [gamma proteobacterium SS-5]
MADQVLEELWATKDSIAKEQGYSIDRLAAFFMKKQVNRQIAEVGEKVAKPKQPPEIKQVEF